MSTPEQGPQPYGAPPPPPPSPPPPSADPGPQEEDPQRQDTRAYGQQPFGGAGSGYPGPPMPSPPPWAQYGRPTGELGTMRPTGMTILLVVVTFGIWGLVYYFQTQEEMKRHTGEGLGGVLALIIGIVSPFLLSNEVGKLYERSGQTPPVTALTGLWFFPGIFILVGPFIWFVRTNRALNDYWRSQGVTRTSLV